MGDSRGLLKSILGEQGYETLEKAIYHSRTQAVSDPLEYYLPLMVVPRSILSWLVQNVKPMKPGENREMNFPGRDDIKMYVQKQANDQYRMQFVQGGRVIHEFEKQSLPAASGHLMTVGELYSDFEPKKEEAPAGEGPDKYLTDGSLAAVRQIMSIADVKPSEDPENVKWAVSHANVREMTAVIGKLIDALTAKNLKREKMESELDKAAEKESEEAKEKTVAETKTRRADTKEVQPSMSYQELDKLKSKPVHDLIYPIDPEINPDGKARVDTPSEEKPFSTYKDKKQFRKQDPPMTPKVDPAGKARVDTPHEEKPFSTYKDKKQFNKTALSTAATANVKAAAAQNKVKKGILSPTESPAPSGSYSADKNKPTIRGVELTPPQDHTIAKKGYFRKKLETLSKPYTSDAQRRWAHTEAGTKALGGKESVHHWDEETKGKKLPEHARKGERQPHPGPSRSEHQKVYDAKIQSQKEAHLKTPAGEAERQRRNSENAARIKKDSMAPSMAQAVADKLGDKIEQAGSVKLKIKKDEKESKQVTSHSSPSGPGGMTNVKQPKGSGGLAFPVLASEKTSKAEMPKGAGQATGPKPPQMPKPPTPAGSNPAASATKQSVASGKGSYKPPQTPGTSIPKNPTIKPKSPAAPKMPGMSKSDYFRKKLKKSEGLYSQATEEQLYKSVCSQCGVPEFVKGTDGHPRFQPCACFLITKKDEEGNPRTFVKILKKSDGSYSMEFDKKADPDTVKLFLTTLKSRLLKNKTA